MTIADVNPISTSVLPESMFGYFLAKAAGYPVKMDYRGSTEMHKVNARYFIPLIENPTSKKYEHISSYCLQHCPDWVYDSIEKLGFSFEFEPAKTPKGRAKWEISTLKISDKGKVERKVAKCGLGLPLTVAAAKWLVLDTYGQVVDLMKEVKT